MSPPRAHTALAVGVLATTALVLGLTSPTPARSSVTFALPSTSAPTRSPDPLRVVGLGDSVPAAYHCDCSGFVSVAAHTLAAERGRPAATRNHAVSGATSADLLTQLTQPAVRTDVASADVVVIEIGANDFDENDAYDDSCRDAATSGCFDTLLSALGDHLQRIVQDVQGLDPRATVVLLGYWNVFRDGAVGAAQGRTYVATSTSLTRQVNAVVQRTADDAGVKYADVFTPFKGPDGDSDDSSFLSDDGDHPNALGHGVLAEAVVRAVDG